MSARRTLQDVGSSNRSEQGFTVVELIIAVVLLTFVTGGISAAFVTGVLDTKQTSGRVKASNDAQVVAAFLVRDAQAAGGVDPTHPGNGGDATLGVSLGDPAGCAATTGTLKFRFSWREWLTSTTFRDHVANYFYVSGTKELKRASCVTGSSTDVSTIGNNITAVSPSCDPAACPPLPNSVSLTITAPNNPGSATSTLYTYTLSATVRAQGYTVPPGAPTSGFPTLLALGGNCATGTPGVVGSGGAQLNVNGTTVINGATTAPPSCNLTSTSGGASFTSTPAPVFPPNGLPDPFLTMPAPNGFTDCAGGSHPSPTTDGAGVDHYYPGVYPGGISVTKDTTFESGIYFSCNGLAVDGNSTVTATGVLFYVAQGVVSIGSAKTKVSMTGVTSGPYSGFTVWMPRSNSATTMSLKGNSSVSVQFGGLFYAPNVDVTISGGSGIQLGSIIARTISFSGGSATQVGPYSATDTVTASVNPVTAGSQVTYTATVTGAGPTPTGSVTFMDGGTPIGSCGVAGVVNLNAGGVATCAVTYGSTASSPHSITAPYTGDSNYASSAGNAVSEQVTTPAPPSVSAITRLGASPTKANSLSWQVTFSSQVKNVVAGDFSIVTSNTGGTTPSISTVTGPAPSATWTVTVSTAGTTGTNAGSIGLNLTSAGTISDQANQPLSTANLPFAGQAYVYDTTAPTATQVSAVNVATLGKMDSGDQIVFTFSEKMAPSSIKAGWDGTSTLVTINVTDGGAANDSLNLSGVNLGSVNLGNAGWVTASNPNNNGSGTMVLDATGTVLTITFGYTPNKAGTNVPASTLIWSPSTSATDAAGNQMTNATATHTLQRF